MSSATSELEQQIEFIVEIDRLKGVLRQNYLTDGCRRENSAEHSWHVALMALILGEHAGEPVNAHRVIELLLVHDLVEIDAGDTFAYDAAGAETQDQREKLAADRIFGLLPEAQALRLRQLWDEFAAGETPESRFALAVDRLMPMIHNSLSEGRAWRANNVVADQVRKRAESISRGAPALGALANRLINASVATGILPDPVRAP